MDFTRVFTKLGRGVIALFPIALANCTSDKSAAPPSQEEAVAGCPPTSTTFTVTTPANGMTVSGVIDVRGQAGSQWVNVAAYDVSGAKIDGDTTPSNGSFSMPIDTTRLPEGPATLTISAFSVPAGQPGGVSVNVDLGVTVDNAGGGGGDEGGVDAGGGDAGNDVPAPAAAVGYGTRTFGPNVTMGANWRPWGAGVNVTQNGDGTVTIAGGGNGYNAQIISAAPGGTGSYSGTVFANGGYFESTFSFEGTPVTEGGWPAWWANDIENQINAQTGNGASQWPGQPSGYVNSIETDFVEFLAGPGAYGFAMHDWYGFQASIQDVATVESGSPTSLPPGTDTSKPHKYGFLWVPATDTTQGYAEWYFDRTRVGNRMTWNRYDPSNGPPPQSGSTAWSVLDARHLYLIHGTGPTNPQTVYAVEVWQRSVADSTTR